MNYHQLTDWPSLWEIARDQRIEDPASCLVVCASCGVQLNADGILHWPDCEDHEQIVFLKQDPSSGEWTDIGQHPADTGPIAF